MTPKGYKKTQKEIEELVNDGGILKRLYEKAEKEENEGLKNRITILGLLYSSSRITAVEWLARLVLLYVNGKDYNDNETDQVKAFFGE